MNINKYLKLLIQLSLGMLSSIFLFFFLGYYLDLKFNLKGIPIIIGVFIGIACGFFYVSKIVTNMITGEK
jgi:F0F1-type ATP synthase assembly protein I